MEPQILRGFIYFFGSIGPLWRVVIYFFMRLKDGFCSEHFSNHLPFDSFSFSVQDVLGNADFLSEPLSDI